MSVCRNKASNSLQTLGSSLKKNERKKERHGKVKIAKRMNCFVSQTKEKKDSLCFDEEQLRCCIS